ncbi:MAG: pyridoxal phosphate-dependent aminotransferase [Methanomassiliicoccales archaeon]
MLEFSDRSKLIVQSEIRNMTLECTRTCGLNLAQGVCDMDAPRVVIDGAYEAMKAGVNAYTRYDGLPELRNAIARKFLEFNKVDISSEKNVVVSSGATGAFYSACMALLNPGDEVVLLEPFYQYHLNTLLAIGAVPVFCEMRPPSWSLDEEELKAAITPRTKAIVVNTPGNPSGKVFTGQEMNLLADLCLEHDLFLLSDEIYEYFVYDGRKHISPISSEKVRDRAIVISGYSKTFNITGWRIGYCVCDERWAQMIGHVSDLVYVCAPAPLQWAVAKGINELPQSYYEGISSEHQRKRSRIVAALKEAGLEPHVPQGAYYVLADVSSVPGSNSKEKAMEILHRTGVASVPGSAFYARGGGENLVRFCYAKKDEILDDACRRLRTLRN